MTDDRLRALGSPSGALSATAQAPQLLFPHFDDGGYFIGCQPPLSSMTAKSFELETLFSSYLNVLYKPLTGPGMLKLLNIYLPVTITLWEGSGVLPLSLSTQETKGGEALNGSSANQCSEGLACSRHPPNTGGHNLPIYLNIHRTNHYK